MEKIYRCGIVSIMLVFFFSCTTTKHVPQGAYLLDEVEIVSDTSAIASSSLQKYLRQRPNSKWFNFLKVPLYIYGWSGLDSTKWNNRLLRRLGDAPILYSDLETRNTQQELIKALHNRGYMRAVVSIDTTIVGRKIKVKYNTRSGKPYQVEKVNYNIADDLIANFVYKDTLKSYLKSGMIFDVTILNRERSRIESCLREKGFFKFTKKFITYQADTVRNSFKVNLTLKILPYTDRASEDSIQHPRYKIRKIHFSTDYDLLNTPASAMASTDTLLFGYPFHYKKRPFLRPKLLIDRSYFKENDWYNERDLDRTYASYSRLHAIRFTNIKFEEVKQEKKTNWLDAYITLTKNKPKSFTAEIEGTNSAGDLGAAVSLSYQHRNLFRGSELLTLKLRGAYESMSGLENYASDAYIEYGVELRLNFPRFLFPFLTDAYKRRIKASTEFSLQYNAQVRPEYERTIASGTWSYKWTNHLKIHHKIDAFDIDYVYLPRISSQFKRDYIDNWGNSILRFNYQNLLLVKMGYTYTYNSRGGVISNNVMVPNSYSIRAHVESSGNALYALSKLTHQKKEDDTYKVFNVAYGQYVKGDFSYTHNLAIDERNSLTFHLGVGIAYPYGNSTILPFEKRYFSGGANSVRGWGVRELGPGSYVGNNSEIDFMNQSGDLKLDLNLEYRTHLFWLLNGAFFLDAGNIWTLRNYKEQSGGQFTPKTFLKDIALAYGLGLRFDFNFVVLRFDGGMKAINPIYDKVYDRYPIFHPNFRRDFALHFAVGYPF